MQQTLFKYTLILYGSIYTYAHILNIKNAKLTRHQLVNKLLPLLSFIYSLCCFPIIYFVRNSLSMFTILVMFLLMCLYCSLVYKRNIATTMCISIISLGIGYIFNMLSTLMVSPIFYIFFTAILKTEVVLSDIVFLNLAINIFSFFIITCMFRTKRFKNGIPEMEKFSYSAVGVGICSLVLLLSTMLFYQNTKHVFRFFLIAFLIIIMSFVLYLWWIQHIKNIYINRSNHKTIEILELANKEQEAEIEKLSKLIHKDNKLISALEMSVKDLYNATTNKDCIKLLDELSFLYSERHQVIEKYENNNTQFLKTNIYNVDIMIHYLYKKAIENHINLKLAVLGNLDYMVSQIVDTRTIVTLLSELGENAIHSIANTTNRNILISIGERNNTYFLEIYDSGYAFDEMVIQNLGQRRYTTRKSDGGSGMGLMNVFDIIRKNNASFETEYLENNSLFTKRVSVIFDSKSEVRVC